MKLNLDNANFYSVELTDPAHENELGPLKILAEKALRDFGIKPIDVETVSHSQNTTLRVDSSNGCFILRISRPGHQSAENIQSEIIFLLALIDSGFGVPCPWQGRLVIASVPEVPEPHCTVLFSWLEGRSFRSGLTPTQAYLVGKTIAKMHQFSRSWSPPDDFDRQPVHKWAYESIDDNKVRSYLVTIEDLKLLE